jgi:cysteinyl-tRNA synthetase
MKLYNSLSRKYEEFKPNKHVRMLVCGPTLYDYMHIGHARLFVTLDVFARYLGYLGYKPLILIILTDIDPKIYRKARDIGINYNLLIEKYLSEFKRDLNLLNIDHNNIAFALASDYAKHAHDIIIQLLDNDYAYFNKGNVYFDTLKIDDYGILSRLSKEELETKPIDLIEGKRNTYDFLIWNGREELDYSINSSLLGKGLPWWHIQDASIALTNFGSYDLHAGAIELIYPHHEAQRAELKAFNHDVKYWFHIGLVTIDKMKMGKSKDNVIKVRDALTKYSMNALRLYLLSEYYRDDIEYDPNILERFHKKSKDIRFGSKEIILDRFDTRDIISNIDEINKDAVEEILGLRV